MEPLLEILHRIRAGFPKPPVHSRSELGKRGFGFYPRKLSEKTGIIV
jgi:hypothetical protein